MKQQVNPKVAIHPAVLEIFTLEEALNIYGAFEPHSTSIIFKFLVTGGFADFPLPALDPLVKLQWLAALRSGNYLQGTGGLRDNGEFCCIGVLCDTVDPTQWHENWSGIGRFFYQNSTSFAPVEFDQFGVRDGVQELLIGFNDRGASFNSIAKFIERYL